MKKILKIGLTAVAAGIIGAGVFYGNTLYLIYRSFQAFKEEHMAHSFQTMYEIQPSVKIPRGKTVSKLDYQLKPLPETFPYQDSRISTEKFLEDSKTSGLLVLADHKIAYEQYFLGAGENTRFSSNSVGKSFVSTLIGIAIGEGHINSVDDSIAAYIKEFQNTEMEKITIKDCLQMSSGIDFDEERDMGPISIKSLFGASRMKAIVKYGLSHKPGTHREYSSINTDILGEVLSNATGQSLSDYMEEKLWSRLGVEKDAYWTLSNKKELANGGLHIALRDYGRFALLFTDHGRHGGEQIIPESWIRESAAADAPHLKAPNDGEPFGELGYGYQWWIPEGSENERLAIGVFGQWIYMNPDRNVVIVKTSADPDFENGDCEKKTLALFREITKSVSPVL